MLDKYLKNVTVIEPKTELIQDKIIPPTIIEAENISFGPTPFSHYHFSAYFNNESKFMKDIFTMYTFLDIQIYLKITDYGLTFFNRDGYGKFLSI